MSDPRHAPHQRTPELSRAESLVAPPVSGEVAAQVEGQLGPDELPDPGEVVMNTEAKLKTPHDEPTRR